MLYGWLISARDLFMFPGWIGVWLLVAPGSPFF